LDGAMEVHDDIIRHRVIMNFKQDGFSTGKVQSGIRTMIREGNFNADVVVVDGFEFDKASENDIRNFKQFAAETGIEVWFLKYCRNFYPTFRFL
jgi:hypothetical protein